jgi:benzoyl-CoA reductase subunit C
MIDNFYQILNNRHQLGQQWHREGRKVIGYICNYAPEEIIYASGAIPVTIMSDQVPPSIADGHFQAFYCPFSRSCIDQALRGEYDYLDGLVYAYACDHQRGIFNIWARNKPGLYAEFIDMPSRVDLPEAKTFYTHELKKFQASLQKAMEINITDELLWEAIEIYDTHRSLLRKLYELRTRSPSPIWGWQVLTVLLAGMVMPKEEHNKLLRQLLQELEEQNVSYGPSREATKESPNGQIRLMIVGSEVDDPRIYQLIEEAGAIIVADDICNGSRYIWGDTPRVDDPIEAIAQRYLDKVPCPVKHPPQRRYEHILSLAEHLKVQGVIILHQKFCDPHEWEYPYLNQLFKEKGLISSVLEIDPTFSEEEIRNQAEALIERIGE